MKAVKTTGAVHGWLLSDVPDSALQARCQRFYLAWLAFRGNPIAMTGLAIGLILLLTAIFAPWIAQSNGLDPDLKNRLLPGSAEHWFGTDELGRDIFDRIVWGSRITLYIVGLVTIIVVPVGLLIGIVAGYLGGVVDNVLMRITDIFLAFPRLILALAFVAALGPGLKMRSSPLPSRPGHHMRALHAPKRSRYAIASSSWPHGCRGLPPSGFSTGM